MNNAFTVHASSSWFQTYLRSHRRHISINKVSGFVPPQSRSFPDPPPFWQCNFAHFLRPFSVQANHIDIEALLSRHELSKIHRSSMVVYKNERLRQTRSCPHPPSRPVVELFESFVERAPVDSSSSHNSRLVFLANRSGNMLPYPPTWGRALKKLSSAPNSTDRTARHDGVRRSTYPRPSLSARHRRQW
jgi:hypothetical protein